MFSTAANSASGKKEAFEFQFDKLSKKSSCVRTVGQITQIVAATSFRAVGSTKPEAKSPKLVGRSMGDLEVAPPSQAPCRCEVYTTFLRTHFCEARCAKLREQLLVSDCDWGADAHRFKEIFRHE